MTLRSQVRILDVADEVVAFEALPHAFAACRLCRYDDAGKDPHAEAPPVGSCCPLLSRFCSRGQHGDGPGAMW